MPIYIVTNVIESGGTPTKERRLIDARNQAQAIAHAVSTSMRCCVAQPMDLVDCTKAGIEIEKANGAP